MSRQRGSEQCLSKSKMSFKDKLVEGIPLIIMFISVLVVIISGYSNSRSEDLTHEYHPIIVFSNSYRGIQDIGFDNHQYRSYQMSIDKLNQLSSNLRMLSTEKFPYWKVIGFARIQDNFTISFYGSKYYVREHKVGEAKDIEIYRIDSEEYTMNIDLKYVNIGSFNAIYSINIIFNDVPLIVSESTKNSIQILEVKNFYRKMGYIVV